MTLFDQKFNTYVAQVKEMLELHFNQQSLAAKKPLIIVGLSGGPDSVFLLYLLYAISQENKIELVAAHLDHGWRKNSADDVAWCKELCNKLSVTFYHEHANNINLTKKVTGSAEAKGRLFRRTFFEDLAKRLEAHLIALGHHADDQQETFFLRLIRGSSLSGLTCMQTFTGNYFRPLLNIPKSFIFEYLHAEQIAYLTDFTNESTDYLRNRIRHLVIPTLQACDSRFDKKLTSTIQNLRDEDDFLQGLTQQTFEKLFIKDEKTNIFKGNLSEFKTLHPVLQKRILIHWLVQSRAHFTPQHSFLLELLKFLNNAHGGVHQLHETWSITKQGKHFWIIIKPTDN